MRRLKPPPLWPVIFVTLFSLVWFTGCPPGATNPQPDADAQSQSDSAPAPNAGCAAWCTNAAALHCPAAAPTPAGSSCVDVCTNTIDGPAPMNVACRAKAPSCEQADACENGPPRAMAADEAGVAAAPVAATCANWCIHAANLKCPAAKATAGGASCSAVCANVQSGPKPFALKCRIAAHTCAAADACEK